MSVVYRNRSTGKEVSLAQVRRAHEQLPPEYQLNYWKTEARFHEEMFLMTKGFRDWDVSINKVIVPLTWLSGLCGGMALRYVNKTLVEYLTILAFAAITYYVVLLLYRIRKGPSYASVVESVDTGGLKPPA